MRAVQLDEYGPAENYRIVEIPIPEPNEDEVLIKVEKAGIIFADSQMRRGDYVNLPPSLPIIPGREVAGTVEKVGTGVSGVKPGMRVTATMFTGGYAEYIYLLPGTAVYAVPDCLSDEVATPANCALSTMVNAVESIGLAVGETVLIQGAGMLGLNLIALCKAAGAAKVIVTDVSPDRLAFASRFGADACFNTADYLNDELAVAIRSLVGGHGVDVAFEVCGNREVVQQALKMLRIGGRYLIAGLVTPGSDLDIDGNQLARNYLTLKGIHNYHPNHLAKALKFLEHHSHKYPYDELVGAKFPLAKINEAIEVAASGKYIRVAIC